MTPVLDASLSRLRAGAASSRRQLRAVGASLSQLDTDRAVGPTVGAAVVFDALVYASVRYAPEYLRLLGTSPVAIGLFGSVGIAVSRLGARRSGGPSRWLAAGLAALGLFCWTVAGAVGGAAVLLVAGTVLVGPWCADSADRLGRSVTERGYSGYHLTPVDGRSGVAIFGMLVVTVVLAAGTVLAGLRVAMALATTFGVAVTVAAVVEDPPRLDAVGAIGLPSLPTAVPKPHLVPGRLVAAVRAVPAGARALVFGSTLVTMAPAAVSVFVVVTVTTTLDPSLTVAGAQLGSAAAFGLLLSTELVVGAASYRFGDALERWLGSKPLAIWGLFVSATFPLLLVGVAPEFTSFVVLFALYGTRFGAVAARQRLLADAVPDTAGRTLPATTRTVRDAMVVVAPAIGGVLYGASPTLAFGAATTVGAVGLREYVRACYL
ncbi:hypothetical protein NDI56_14340 [Haloarcula sp. S1CR25-12]|uniref:MFS transporter n=1 Tax=Haloarcula saliterrae TaxID=2950534 RepID=A0ABU2FE90_9EURY|nr:hypothetical protein [Haloarcula sp. S1CR25-12]MDS0260582.1 hypothetical protein [Haloarcula sp. S1CR25-12]